MDYRQRIYAKYATHVQRHTQPISLADADRWGVCYDGYLRGWLPASKDAAIVDLACGCGRLLRFFAQRGYTQVTGVDISAEQVELARHLHPQVQQANVLDFLNVHPRSFDLITAIDLIEHLHKNEVMEFLDACHAALRPGGRLILQTPNADSPYGTMLRYADFTHEIGLNALTLGWLLTLCGFERFEARELGPAPHGMVSSVRFVLWKLIRLRFLLEQTIEMGSIQSRVITRVFIATAIRPLETTAAAGGHQAG